jgi:hypothetical protein
MNSRSSQFARDVVLAVKGRGRSLAVLGVFFLGLSFPAFSQEATILGTVTDPSGSVVPNVKIRITHVETGEVRNATTNDTGQYVAADLPIGHYNVGAQASGFKMAEHKDVVLNVAARAAGCSLPPRASLSGHGKSNGIAEGVCQGFANFMRNPMSRWR